MDLNLKFKTEAFEFCIWECGPKSSVLLRKMGEKKKEKKKKPGGFYPTDSLDIAFIKPQKRGELLHPQHFGIQVYQQCSPFDPDGCESGNLKTKMWIFSPRRFDTL